MSDLTSQTKSPSPPPEVAPTDELTHLRQRRQPSSPRTGQKISHSNEWMKLPLARSQPWTPSTWSRPRVSSTWPRFGIPSQPPSPRDKGAESPIAKHPDAHIWLAMAKSSFPPPPASARRHNTSMGPYIMRQLVAADAPYQLETSPTRNSRCRASTALV